MDLISPSSANFLFWSQLVLPFGYLGFWIYALRDLINAEFRDAHSKLIWALIILVTPLGPFLYLSLSRRNKKREFKPKFSNHNFKSNHL